MGCIHDCPCLHEGKCDPLYGNCSCHAGWIGPYCEEKCQEGYYGVVSGVNIYITLYNTIKYKCQSTISILYCTLTIDYFGKYSIQLLFIYLDVVESENRNDIFY